MSAVASSMTLPDDPEVDGNKYCGVCAQSLKTARVAAHLVSQKHLSRMKKANDRDSRSDSGDDRDQEDSKTHGAGSTVADKKPAKRAERKLKSAKSLGKSRRHSDSGSSSSTSESSDDDRAAPSSRKKVSTKAASRSSAQSSREKPLLPLDPKKQGNHYCGICSVSVAASRIDAHLDTEKHHKNAMRTVSEAMQRTTIK